MIHSNRKVFADLFGFHRGDLMLETNHPLHIFDNGIKIMCDDEDGFFPFESF